MLVLLHGDHIQASRKALTDRIAEYGGIDVRTLDGRLLDVSSLSQALTPLSFLSDKPLVVVENLLTKTGKKSKNLSVLMDLILEAAKTVDIIVWEGEEVGKTGLSLFGKDARVQLFKLPVSLFQFLDCMRPGGRKQALELFHLTLSSEPSELIFALLVKRVRQLLLVKKTGTFAGLAPWQLSRLTSQAGFFTIDQLRGLYRKFLDIEYRIKSGASALSLQRELELCIISLS